MLALAENWGGIIAPMCRRYNADDDDDDDNDKGHYFNRNVCHCLHGGSVTSNASHRSSFKAGTNRVKRRRIPQWV